MGTRECQRLVDDPAARSAVLQTRSSPSATGASHMASPAPFSRPNQSTADYARHGGKGWQATGPGRPTGALSCGGVRVGAPDVALGPTEERGLAQLLGRELLASSAQL